jgi:hypothetical protein
MFRPFFRDLSHLSGSHPSSFFVQHPSRHVRHILSIEPSFVSRQPEGKDLSGYAQREFNTIAHRLNTHSRKRLRWETPFEVVAQLHHYY